MKGNDIFMWLIGMMCAGILAVQIAYASSLAQDVKTLFGLDAESDYSKRKWKPWFQPVLFIWLTLREMLQCPYCISYHIAWMLNLWMFGLPAVQSFVYALTALFGVSLYKKLDE